MAIGEALGWINTRVILGFVYYGIMTPMGMTMRLLGKDPMRRRFEPDANSYRVPRATRPSRHMDRQF